MQTVKMKVAGMTCGGCVASVSRVVKALPGVEAARVDLANASAEVDYDPARCDAGAIRNAIEAAGYDVAA